MALPNARWPNTSRPNSMVLDTESRTNNLDVRLVIPELFDEGNDLRIGVSTTADAVYDTLIRIVESIDEYSDISLTISEARDEGVDVEIRIVNPISLDENIDIRLQTWPAEGVDYDEDNDLFVEIVEAVSENSDLLLELVESISDHSDIRIGIDESVDDLTDVVIRIHTDVLDVDVVDIARILERRFLPYFNENVMFRAGADTERYKLFHAFATAEMNARQRLEDTLLNMRLMFAERAALDYVGDRVGERRWQFYENVTDRFENDDNYRARLIPYFQSKRATLDALESAVAPLHDSYGGHSAFYSYRIGEGWMLGGESSSVLARSTYLGGPELDLNPLEYLIDEDLWVMGTGLRTITGPVRPQPGRTRVVGDGASNRFVEDLRVGEYLFVSIFGVDTYVGQVAEIIDNNNLELVSPASVGTGVTWYVAKAKPPDGSRRPDTGGHSNLGITTFLGDRERLSPFTFLVVVTNYPEIESWRRLYLHTIDRFRACGTVPIVVFRRASMLNQYYLAGDGTSTYTIPNRHLQGVNAVVFVANVHQSPDSYTLTNSGDDTILSFSENVETGWSIWVYWVEDPA